MENKQKAETPRVDALEELSKVFTERQLLMVALYAARAKGESEDGQADLVIRWKDGKPRWMGVQGWEEMKP